MWYPGSSQPYVNFQDMTAPLSMRELAIWAAIMGATGKLPLSPQTRARIMTPLALVKRQQVIPEPKVGTRAR